MLQRKEHLTRMNLVYNIETLCTIRYNKFLFEFAAVRIEKSLTKYLDLDDKADENRERLESAQGKGVIVNATVVICLRYCFSNLIYQVPGLCEATRLQHARRPEVLPLTKLMKPLCRHLLVRIRPACTTRTFDEWFAFAPL